MADEAHRIHGLSELADAVQNSATVNHAVARTASSALTLLSGASVSVSRVEQPHARLRVIHNAGDLSDTEEPWPADQTHRLADVPHLRQTVGMAPGPWTGSVDDQRTDPADRDLIDRCGKRHALSLPVLTGHTVWGEVWVTRSRARRFDRVDIDTGVTLVGLLSAGLSRLELLTELSLLAYSDPLTGLANRRAADDWLEQRLAAAEPFAPVSLVLCDINGLKPVNDRFGHAAGDELIQRVAGHLVVTAGSLAETTVARIGGDEFVVLLQGPSEQQVKALVERLAAFEVPYAAGLAVGAATTTRRSAGAESAKSAARALLRLADAAQYQHKQTRRLSTRTVSLTDAPISVLLPAGGSQLTDRVLAAWAGSHDDRGVLCRLAVVADEVARVFDAGSWFVSRERGGLLAEEMGWLLGPRSASPLPLDLVTGQDFDSDDYPATKAALDGGGYYASLTQGDDAERALIARMGYVSALAAGERDADGDGWLVELFGDGATSSGLFVALPLLRALVHLAVTGATPAVALD